MWTKETRSDVTIVADANYFIFERILKNEGFHMRYENNVQDGTVKFYTAEINAVRDVPFKEVALKC